MLMKLTTGVNTTNADIFDIVANSWKKTGNSNVDRSESALV